jgi:hypothetical protein
VFPTHSGLASHAARKAFLASSRLNVLALEAAEKCQVSVQALSTRYILPIVSPSLVTTEKVVGVRLALR